MGAVHGLREGHVHVWRAHSDAPPYPMRVLQTLLSPEEQRRARRFRFERDRTCHVVARGLLRVILGHYLSCAPSHLRLAEEAHGKPFLARPAYADVHFNVSHSHRLIAIAVARRRVGVDVERVRALDDMGALARRFFSAQEHVAWQRLAPEQRPAAFFRCWTRKEAYVKARGEGLSFPLGLFDVSLSPSEPAALLSTRADPREADRWTLLDLDLQAGYQAAVVVEGPVEQVVYPPWLVGLAATPRAW